MDTKNLKTRKIDIEVYTRGRITRS
uniref:Uncharacterized protein n=1 Tax=Rhizophora mucronata TaxID=61149 RepID=A0A2P2IZ97_RHIMU